MTLLPRIFIIILLLCIHSFVAESKDNVILTLSEDEALTSLELEKLTTIKRFFANCNTSDNNSSFETQALNVARDNEVTVEHIKIAGHLYLDVANHISSNYCIEPFVKVAQLTYPYLEPRLKQNFLEGIIEYPIIYQVQSRQDIYERPRRYSVRLKNSNSLNKGDFYVVLDSTVFSALVGRDTWFLIQRVPLCNNMDQPYSAKIGWVKYSVDRATPITHIDKDLCQ